MIEEIEFTGIMSFCNAVLSYQKEINGKMHRADLPPHIGIVVYNTDSSGNEIGKYFTIETQYVKDLKSLPQELVDSVFGKQDIPRGIPKLITYLDDVQVSTLIFVDGELYKGNVIYNNYKGIGWSGGRAAGVFLEKKLAARYQEVSILDLKYGKLRHCKFNPNGAGLRAQLESKETYWDVIDMPSDLEGV